MAMFSRNIKQCRAIMSLTVKLPATDRTHIVLYHIITISATYATMFFFTSWDVLYPTHLIWWFCNKNISKWANHLSPMRRPNFKYHDRSFVFRYICKYKYYPSSNRVEMTPTEKNIAEWLIPQAGVLTAYFISVLRNDTKNKFISMRPWINSTRQRFMINRYDYFQLDIAHMQPLWDE